MMKENSKSVIDELQQRYKQAQYFSDSDFSSDTDEENEQSTSNSQKKEEEQEDHSEDISERVREIDEKLSILRQKARANQNPSAHRSEPAPSTNHLSNSQQTVRASENPSAQRTIPSDPNSQRESSSAIKLNYRVDELITSEEHHLRVLKTGLNNYKSLFNEENKLQLPKSLKGMEHVLLRNMEDILEFHEEELLPMFLKYRYNLELLFTEFSKFIDNGKFYGHLMYNMHKKYAEKLLTKNSKYFQEKAKTFNDKLGILDFVTKPLIRLMKYPDIIKEIVKFCFKNYEYKALVESAYKLDEKLKKYIKLVNESESIHDIKGAFDINFLYQGRLKKIDLFSVFDQTSKKSFYANVYYFEKCIVYAEIVKKKLYYRGCYPYEKIGMVINENYFMLCYEKTNDRKCDFKARTKETDGIWIKLVEEMQSKFKNQEIKFLEDTYGCYLRNPYRAIFNLALYRHSKNIEY